MKLWQLAMVPPETAYQIHGDGRAQDEAKFKSLGADVFADISNRGRQTDVLLMSPNAFENARRQVEFARDAGAISQAQAEAEWGGLEEARLQVAACRDQIKALNKAWREMEKFTESQPAGDPQAAKKQQACIDRFAKNNALWLLPNFIAWGEHRPVDLNFWREKCPKILAAAKIDEKNAFLACANLDYGSFNLRMCAVVALVAERGNLDPAAAEEILTHARRLGSSASTVKKYHMGWGLDELGNSFSFPDHESLGPRAMAVLEAFEQKRLLTQTVAEASAAPSSAGVSSCEPKTSRPSRARI